MKKVGKIIMIAVSAVLVAAVCFSVFYACLVESIHKTALVLLDENYDYLYSVFGDKLATKDQYIDAFDNTYENTQVYYIPNGNFQGEEIDRIGKKNIVRIEMLSLNQLTDNDDYATMLIHEIKHSENQSQVNAMNMYSARRITFSEGAAKFWEVFSTRKCFFTDGCIMPETENGLTCNYGFTADWEHGYGTGSNAYLKLLMLTDYDTLQRFTENPYNTDILYSKVKENYGKDSDSFVRSILHFNNTYADYVLNTDNKFLNEYFIMDVDGISSREDAVKLLNMYRFFKAEGITYVYDEEMNDHTSEYIDFEPVENALFENVRKYGLLNSLTTDEEEQRFIFNSLLYVPRGTDEFDINDLPKSINDLTLVFDKNKHALYIKDTETDEVIAWFAQSGKNLSRIGANYTNQELPETAFGRELVIK